MFGIVLFLAVKASALLASDWLEQGWGLFAGTRSFAILAGVLGGFGGPGVLKYLLELLKRLIDRFFPEQKGRGSPKTV